MRDDKFFLLPLWCYGFCHVIHSVSRQDEKREPRAIRGQYPLL